MQRLKDEPRPPPDQAWFRRLIAIAVLYRAAEKKIRSLKFPAYGAQITAYVVSGIANRAGGRLDFDRLWSKQTVSTEMEELIAACAPQLDTLMRRSAGQKNPSEWFKKADCWTDIQGSLPLLANPLPPELSYVTADDAADSDHQMLPAAGSHSEVDYERIARCMRISSAIWLEVAERGQSSATIHWKVAGICRTLASYAAGGWTRKPSAKQAKPALGALRVVHGAGLLSQPIDGKLLDRE